MIQTFPSPSFHHERLLLEDNCSRMLAFLKSRIHKISLDLSFWQCSCSWTNHVPTKPCLLSNLLERQVLPNFAFCIKVTVLNPEDQVDGFLAVGKRKNYFGRARSRAGTLMILWSILCASTRYGLLPFREEIQTFILLLSPCVILFPPTIAVSILSFLP